MVDLSRGQFNQNILTKKKKNQFSYYAGMFIFYQRSVEAISLYP